MRVTPYKVTMWVDGVPKEVHRFTLEYNKKGWYISVISIGAFSNRENERLYNYGLKYKSYNMPGKRGDVDFGKQIDIDEGITCRAAEAGYVEPELPEFHHDSVWDFYKAIGYDYKKKRYIN